RPGSGARETGGGEQHEGGRLDRDRGDDQSWDGVVVQGSRERAAGEGAGADQAGVHAIGGGAPGDGDQVGDGGTQGGFLDADGRTPQQRAEDGQCDGVGERQRGHGRGQQRQGGEGARAEA